MSSLSELKAIEEERIADERAAVRAAELARVAAREADERAKLEAEAANRREAHEAQLAIENARVAAEREARMKIEAAEAAERARQQALLAEARLVQEMELRRAEVAKQRPTWMLAVTGVATLAAFVLIYVAIDRTRATEDALTKAKLAEQSTRETKRQFEELKVTIAGLETEGHALSDRAAKLGEEIKAADTAAKVAEARKKQAKLDADERAYRAKKAAADELQRKLDRNKKIEISAECQHNVIGKSDEACKQGKK